MGSVKPDVEKSDDNGHHSLGLNDLYRAALEEEFHQKREETFEIFPVKYESNENCYNNDSSVTYHVYETQSSSVLDLDKGVTVETNQPGSIGPVTYVCDSQILQRYLHDVSISLSKEGSHEKSMVIPKPSVIEEPGTGVAPEKLGVKYTDCDFNSSDSFASTESIIPKTIQCPVCPKTFMFKADLTRHKKHKHTPKQKFICSICDKEFVCQQNLAIHERIHKNPEMHCLECKKSYRSLKTFLAHMEQKHNDTVPFHCNQCPRAYRKPSELEKHKKKLHGAVLPEEPFPCSLCGKVFEKKKGLTAHMKLHNKSFICSTCGAVFNKESALKTHAQQHVCVVINRTSHNVETVSPDLTLACNQQQQPPVPHNVSYPCKICSSVFTNANELKIHRKIHRRKFECPECYRVFPTKKAMGLHISAEHIRSTQEICTQTELFELQNVNLVGDSVTTVAGGTQTEPIAFAPHINFTSVTVPIIISQPSAVAVPYSAS